MRSDITYNETPEFLAPKLIIGDIVFIYNTRDAINQWVQARIIEADLFNGVWDYAAITESTLSNEFDAPTVTIDVIDTFLFNETDTKVEQYLKQNTDHHTPLDRSSACVIVTKFY